MISLWIKVHTMHSICEWPANQFFDSSSYYLGKLHLLIRLLRCSQRTIIIHGRCLFEPFWYLSGERKSNTPHSQACRHACVSGALEIIYRMKCVVFSVHAGIPTVAFAREINARTTLAPCELSTQRRLRSRARSTQIFQSAMLMSRSSMITTACI